jgi:hypothetical protein
MWDKNDLATFTQILEFLLFELRGGLKDEWGSMRKSTVTAKVNRYLHDIKILQSKLYEENSDEEDNTTT